MERTAIMMDEVTSVVGSQRPHAIGNESDVEYAAFLARIQARFAMNTEGGKRPLFVTDANEATDVSLMGEAPRLQDLFGKWLETFEPGEKQFHNCSACRHFVRSYGSLAVIASDGTLVPAFWHAEDAPALYVSAVRAMARAVRRAKVVSPFLASERMWGQPKTGAWIHMALEPAATQIAARYGVLTPSQRMAQKREDYGAVQRALAEFSLKHVRTAVQLLKTDSLYRSEKVLGAAEWLLKLHEARADANGKDKRDNLVWLAVASAPDGFCHPRSSMIGTLLEDIAAGKGYDDVARAFKAKMSPLAYQRPQAAPSAGTIAQAEKVFAELGLAPALRRRFARVDEIDALWRPAPIEAPKAGKGGGLFSHLHQVGGSKPAAGLVPAQTMTFEKFRRTVLPGAKRIEINVPDRTQSFVPFVTAADPDAPPIVQWDSVERRNPFTWYFHSVSSYASQWGLKAGWAPVTAVSLAPQMWADEEKFKHFSKGVLFAVEGARESANKGLALFPEFLRSELHGVRSVIEAHSKTQEIEGREDGSACGLMFQGGEKRWNVQLRVTDSHGQCTVVELDRWD